MKFSNRVFFGQTLVSNILYLVPRKLRYEICRHHANKEFAENRSDFTANGELWLMEQILPSAETLFDVGAYIGKWTSHALHINPNINIHCFEPYKRSFVRLKEKGFGENVTCNQYGLGVENGQEVLYVAEGMSEGGSLYRHQGLKESMDRDLKYITEQVEIRTLDSYRKEKSIKQIDFLKIDVEGNEFAVIEGGMDSFKSEAVRVVLFEYCGANIESRTLLKDFYDFFVGMNYSFFLLYPSSVRPVLRYDQRLENFQYKNFLIVNNNETFKKPFCLQ
nr:FkbM family methyltransferase [Bacteroidota bacterium]